VPTEVAVHGVLLPSRRPPVDDLWHNLWVNYTFVTQDVGG